MSLWDEGIKWDERVQKAVDALRERFGEQTVRWGKEKRRGNL